MSPCANLGPVAVVPAVSRDNSSIPRPGRLLHSFPANCLCNRCSRLADQRDGMSRRIHIRQSLMRIWLRWTWEMCFLLPIIYCLGGEAARTQETGFESEIYSDS